MNRGITLKTGRAVLIVIGLIGMEEKSMRLKRRLKRRKRGWRKTDLLFAMEDLTLAIALMK